MDLSDHYYSSEVICLAFAIGESLYGFCTPVDTPNTWGKATDAACAAIEGLNKAGYKIVKTTET